MIDLYKDNHAFVNFYFKIIHLRNYLQKNQACGAIQALKRL